MDLMRQHTPYQRDDTDPKPAKTVPDGNGWDASGDYDPLDPYDFGSYVDNLWQTVLRAGLITNSRDSKLFIHDRAKAVAWFEQMLADYDEAHPDEGPEPPGGALS